MKDNEIKHKHELDFWSGRVEAEKTLKQISGGAPYEKFYIDDFGFTHEDFEGKRILDIGCGPRGSLEWADMAELRVGLDPLVNDYYKLGGGTIFHKMTYVNAYSEDMPFTDELFDFVFTINSLDHVDDLDETISEIKRVLKVGGICGIIVDANHPPRPAEPIFIELNLKDKFLDVFEVLEEKVLEDISPDGFRDNLDNPVYYDFEDETMRTAILFLKMRKIRPVNFVPDEETFDSLLKENIDLKNDIEELKNQYKKLADELNELKG